MRTRSTHKTCEEGITLIDTIVGVAIMLIVFMGLFAAFQAALQFGERNRLHTNAVFLANEHIETIRALPFDSVGTVSGIPSGDIPQTETITYRGREYTRRTFIQYVDDPADGTDAADTLAADYKRVKVEISYDYGGTTRSFSIVTTIAPKSQESLTGAGVLRINVTKANNDPLQNATVHILNTSIATSVDITTFTNASGTVSFPGAWEGSGYEVYISKSGYSSAQTYTSSSTNPNPNPSPLNVAEGATTEVYFKIDLLSSIHLFTRDLPVWDALEDDFTDTSKLTSQDGTQVSGGALTLQGSPGTYPTLGTSTSLTLTPSSLDTWLLLSFDTNTPAGTLATLYVEYDTGTGTFARVPNSDLAGNESGFTSSPIDLSSLSTTTYSSLRIYTELTTTDASVTPEVYSYTLSYQEAITPSPNKSFSLTGAKTIGADSSLNPIYKYSTSSQTNVYGTWDASDMEFDTYTLTMSDTVAEACPSLPIVLEPDTDYQQTITIAPASTHNLSVRVIRDSGGVVENAQVRINNGVTTRTTASGPCGIAYFDALTSDTYTVSVIASGFNASSTSVAVSGDTTASVTLIP